MADEKKEKKLTFKEQLIADIDASRANSVPNALIEALKRLAEHVIDDKAKE